jgi:hypothetical protein
MRKPRIEETMNSNKVSASHWGLYDGPGASWLCTEPLCQKLQDKAENLLISIHMGWDLDGVLQALQAVLEEVKSKNKE